MRGHTIGRGLAVTLAAIWILQAPIGVHAQQNSQGPSQGDSEKRSENEPVRQPIAPRPSFLAPWAQFQPIANAPELKPENGESENPKPGGEQKAWYDRFIFDHVTDWLLVIFTAILASKTTGLFRETAGLNESTRKLWETGEAQRTLFENTAADQIREMKASNAAAQASADAAMKSAELAEFAIEAGESPYLYPVMQAGGPLDLPGKDGDTRRPYVLHNYGRSVAIILEIYQDCFYSGRKPEPIPFPPPQRVGSIPFIVGAGEDSMQIRFEPMSKVSREGPDDRTGNGCLIGQVRYADVFGNQFLTGYNYIFSDRVRAPAAVYSVGYNYRRKLTPAEMVIADRLDRMID